MSFFVAAFLATLCLLLFLFLELKGRGERSLQPATLKKLWQYGQKTEAPHVRYPAFLFAAIALFFFQMWEGFLRFLLQREGPLWLSLMALVVLLFLMVVRGLDLKNQSKTDLRIGRYWVLAFFTCTSFLLSAWGTLICLPWIYWRSRFLPARLN